jgi:hypothetical protein
VLVGVFVGVLVGVLVGVFVGVFVGVLVGVAVLVGVLVGVAVWVGVFVGVAVFVGVFVGVAVFVGVFVGVAVLVAVLVGVDVLVGVFVGVAVLVGVFVGVEVLVGVLVGVAVLVGVLVGVGVGVGFAHTPALLHTLGSRQHSPFGQTVAIGGNPPARLLVGQQTSSAVHVPEQHALSQQVEYAGFPGLTAWSLQQAGPTPGTHCDKPAGQTHFVPFQVCTPGHLVGVGVLVPRVAASVLSSSSTLPVAATAPRPSSPFKTVRRLAPEASALVNESKRLSSMGNVLYGKGEICGAAMRYLDDLARRQHCLRPLVLGRRKPNRACTSLCTQAKGLFCR